MSQGRVQTPLPVGPADPVLMLYKLLTDEFSGISVTADDNVTVLNPNLDVPSSGYSNHDPGGDAATILIKQHPYQQEDEIGVAEALIVVGPARDALNPQHTIGYALTEIVQPVEVRIMTRYVDVADQGYQVTEIYRRKILAAIRNIVQTFTANPDGTGTFNKIEYMGMFRDRDEPQGVPLYKTPILIAVTWIE